MDTGSEAGLDTSSGAGLDTGSEADLDTGSGDAAGSAATRGAEGTAGIGIGIGIGGSGAITSSVAVGKAPLTGISSMGASVPAIPSVCPSIDSVAEGRENPVSVGGIRVAVAPLL
ncbi:hypothetical protein D3C80_1659200 [compost metagenome]